MKSTLRLYGFLLACLLVPFVLSGCGTKKVKVHGKVTYGATPIKGAEREPLVITFSPFNGEEKPDGLPVEAQVNQEEGSYEATVPAGKLRISVSRFQDDLSDRFQGVFAQGQSPIIKDIAQDAELNLDLSQYKAHLAGNSESVPMPGGP